MGKRISVISALFLLISSFVVYASEVKTVKQRQVYLDTDSMSVYADILDGQGMRVDALDKKNVTIKLDEDEIDVRSVIPFAESGEGMAYLFLIDTSGSLSRSQFDDLKTATKKWIEKIDEKDRMTIIGFGSEVNVLQDFTNDKEALTNAVEQLTNSDKNTALYNGLYDSLEQTIRIDNGIPNRKAIIVLSDGVNDYDGGVTEEEVLDETMISSIPVYSLFAGKKTNGQNFLKVLSEKTGGNYYDVNDKSIESLYEQIYNEFDRAFVINGLYRLSKADSNVHDVSLTIQNSEDTVADTKQVKLVQSTNTVGKNLEVTNNATNSTTGSIIKDNLLVFIVIGSIIFIALIIFVIAFIILAKSKRNKRVKVKYKKKAKTKKKYDNDYDESNSFGASFNEPVLTPASAEMDLNLAELGSKFETSVHFSESVVIGRDFDSGIVLENPQVSLHHCRIVFEDGALSIEDLGSTNGTTVNGITTNGKAPLNNGDIIGLGSLEYRLYW